MAIPKLPPWKKKPIWTEKQVDEWNRKMERGELSLEEYFDGLEAHDPHWHWRRKKEKDPPAFTVEALFLKHRRRKKKEHR